MFTSVLLTYKRCITPSRFKEYIDSVVVVSCCLFAKSYITLSDSKDYSPPDSSVHGISQARILKWVAISFFQGIIPTQGSSPGLLHWQVGSLPLSYQGSPRFNCAGIKVHLGFLYYLVQFSSVQLLSRVPLFATPWTAACQASLSITNFRSLLRLMSIKLVMPSNHLILCHSLLLLPSIFPSIRVFSNESALWIRWPKYWSFSFSISPSNEHSRLISFRMDWLDLLAVQGTLKSLLQHHSSKASILRHSAFFPTPVLLLGQSHGRRSLVGCSPWGR